ncbi:MAG TPA: OstA-like protein, partial [Flavobacteriales bacterium]|nr:OstA-like protein [Flavobacteriales bacterium]
MPIRTRSPLFLFLLASPFLVKAQSKVESAEGRIEVLNADQWEYDKDRAQGAQRLIGNARFKHVDAIMSCDSAYLYE